MKKKVIVLAILGIFIIATTCGCLNNTENTETEIKSDCSLNMTFLGEKEISTDLTIQCWHDNDRNKTCYVIFDGYSPGGRGISCTSDKDTGK